MCRPPMTIYGNMLNYTHSGMDNNWFSLRWSHYVFHVLLPLESREGKHHQTDDLSRYEAHHYHGGNELCLFRW